MFTSARLKLTAWYLLIIILISASFSLVIYGLLTDELSRVQRMQEQRLERLYPAPDGSLRPIRPIIDPEVIQEAKDRLKLRLLLTNLTILFFAGAAGYFLAGRTLRPIKQMVDEQKRFIADASHELRTPLTSLKSELEVNLRDKDLNLIGAKELLESNLEEVNNLQHLSDNLIRLAQYDKGNGASYFEVVSLREIVDEAIKKVSKLAKAKKIIIKDSIKDSILNAEKQSLVELLVILLDNAIKYSPEKSEVILSSRLIQKNTSVILSAAKDIYSSYSPQNDNWVEIAVKDQGIGIDKKEIPHLFDRFYRSDKARGEDGYGLGLSIAKQIVDKHKGSIKVNSEINNGSIFSVTLPIN